MCFEANVLDSLQRSGLLDYSDGLDCTSSAISIGIRSTAIELWKAYAALRPDCGRRLLS